MGNEMIEDYGTLSEEELLDEILQELEEVTEVDTSELEFKFEGGKLHIYGTLQNEEELENLISVLENHIDPNDYQFDVDLVEGQAPKPALAEELEPEPEAPDEEKFMEESLEDIEEEEVEFVEEEAAEEDEDKW
jgi:hypothetical protein